MRAALHKVAPGDHPGQATAPPVIGGVLLGMEQCALQTSGLRQNLNPDHAGAAGGGEGGVKGFTFLYTKKPAVFLCIKK